MKYNDNYNKTFNLKQKNVTGNLIKQNEKTEI